MLKMEVKGFCRNSTRSLELYNYFLNGTVFCKFLFFLCGRNDSNEFYFLRQVSPSKKINKKSVGMSCGKYRADLHSDWVWKKPD